MIVLISVFFAILFASFDYFFIKNIRPLTKKDKRYTIAFKGIVLSVACKFILLLTAKEIVQVSIATWIIFDVLIGYLLTKKWFYLGNNSQLDKIGDKIDGKIDNRGILYFAVKIFIFVIFSIIW